MEDIQNYCELLIEQARIEDVTAYLKEQYLESHRILTYYEDPIERAVFEDIGDKLAAELEAEDLVAAKLNELRFGKPLYF